MIAIIAALGSLLAVTFFVDRGVSDKNIIQAENAHELIESK